MIDDKTKSVHKIILRPPLAVVPLMPIIQGGKVQEWGYATMKYNYGAVDKSGNSVIDPTFENINIYILETNTLTPSGLCDRTREPITPLQYHQLIDGDFSDNNYEVISDGLDSHPNSPFHEVFLLKKDHTDFDMQRALEWRCARRFYFYAYQDPVKTSDLRRLRSESLLINTFVFNNMFYHNHIFLSHLVQGPSFRKAFM